MPSRFRRRLRALLVLAALCLCASCARRPEPAAPAAVTPAAATASPAPTAEPVPAPAAPAPETAEQEATPAEAAPGSKPAAAPETGPIGPGSYVFHSGEWGSWQLNLKENGTFSLLHDERIYNGEGWLDNGDGTVTTGPTEAAGAAPFFDEFGSSVWTVSGGECRPVY